MAALLSKNQQRKRAGNGLRPGMRMLRRGRGWRAEFRRHEKDMMGLQIKRHGPRAALGGDARDGGELLRRVFVHDGQRAVTVGAEGELGSGVEADWRPHPGRSPASPRTLPESASTTAIIWL